MFLLFLPLYFFVHNDKTYTIYLHNYIRIPNDLLNTIILKIAHVIKRR